MELETSYWKILNSRSFLRTAEEEEEWRFQAAQGVDASRQGAFAKALHRFLLSAFASCPQTAGMSVQFVAAGSLHLDVLVVSIKNTIKVHSKFLQQQTAFADCGMTGKEVPFDNALSILAKQLFSSALYQLTLPWSQSSVPQAEEHVRNHTRAKILCDQKILETARFQQDLEFYVTRSETSDSLMIKWNPKSAWASHSTISIQAHLSSTCSHLQNTHLVSKGGVIGVWLFFLPLRETKASANDG